MQTARQFTPCQKDPATASGAAKPNIAAHARHRPSVRAARMRLAHPHSLADGELRHVGRRQRVRRRCGILWPGTPRPAHVNRTALMQSRISRTAARVAGA